MRLSKGNLPPKTTIDNFLYLDHLERVLWWFLENDKEIQTLKSKDANFLFDKGIRPNCDEDNNPDIFNPKVSKNIVKWVVLRTWLDLMKIMRMAKETTDKKKGDTPFIKIFEEKLDIIEEETKETFTVCFELVCKYKIKISSDMDIETELLKITNEEERKSFEYNYLTDALISSEVRLLVWIYKELFNKNYQIKE